METAVTLPTGGARSGGRALSGNVPAQPAHFPLRSPLSRAALESNRLPGGSHFGPVRPSATESGSALSRGLTASTGRRPRSLSAKGDVSRHFRRGRKLPSAGRPLGGAYWLSARRRLQIPPPAFFTESLAVSETLGACRTSRRAISNRSPLCTSPGPCCLSARRPRAIG